MNNAFMNEVLAGTSFALFDGAMGSMLVREGLGAGELPELLCLEQPQRITAIHRAYVQAGSQFVTTNTFGANRRKLAGKASVQEAFEAGVRCARESGARAVAADIGPLGELLFPLGELSFSQAFEQFAEQARAAEQAGADLIIIETMADVLEAVAAVLAAKASASLPVFATMTFLESGRTFVGTTPRNAALALAMAGADAVGVNCSAGPAGLLPVVQDMLEVAPCPVIAQANAGLPQVIDGVTSYSLGGEDYARAVLPMVEAGASIVGGCCGTDPDCLRAVAQLIADRTPQSHPVNPIKARELARCVADGDDRDAQIMALIVEASDPQAMREALAEEFDED